jgi:hypothetical protein
MKANLNSYLARTPVGNLLEVVLTKPIADYSMSL